MSSEPDLMETAWCAGFSQSGWRELTPAELADLNGLAVRLTGQAWTSVLAGPGVLLALLAAGGVFMFLGHVPNWLMVLLVFALLVAPVGVMVSRDWFLRAQGLRRDAADGWVRQFTGPVDPASGSEETRDLLVRRRLLTPDPRITQGLELLPASYVVWTVNGRRTHGLITAKPNVVAQVPEYAAMAAQWVEPAQQPGSEGMHVNFRDLSSAERLELERHWKKLLLRPLVSALLLTVWAGFAFSLGSWQDSSFGMALVGGFAVWSWFGVYRILTLAGKVRRDAAAGRVVIVRRTLVPGEELSPAEEYLPQSGIPWSAAERPAPWRMRLGK